MRLASECIEAIRSSIREAETAFYNHVNANGQRNSEEYCEEQEDLVHYYLDRAFLELRLFLEAKQLPQMLQAVIEEQRSAQSSFMKGESSSWGDPTSFWAARLRQYLRAINTAFGATSLSTVTKDLITILRATQYSITDRLCFKFPPADESELHTRIEAVLRCVFPDLLTKPPIGKPIKNFVPDTGLPSVQTLIEYKFASSSEDIKRIADEVLADTRGYVSKEWSNFVYVIYETRRLKPETQWASLLKASEVTDNTQIIVISGEEPPNSKASKKRMIPKKVKMPRALGMK